MIEWILIVSMYSSFGVPANAVSAIPFTFATQEECNAAGLKAKSGLLDGGSSRMTVGFVCIQRTNAIPKN